MTSAQVRSCFPALEGGFAFLENAGGSQVPAVVADAVRHHMLNHYVQLGAGYPKSDAATETVARAHDFTAELVNAGDRGRVVLGPSTTSLINLVAEALGRTLREGDEIVVADTNHEANAGCWARLERVGAKVVRWPVDPATFRCEPSALQGLLSQRTKLVTLPHVSNLVGQIEDVAAVVKMVHEVGGRVMADGVAYAPHRAIDVAALGVDWYAFSAYKVYGPHFAALYGTHAAFDELTGPNHFFVPNSEPYKWELGGPSHEACAGWLGLREYLAFVAEDGEYRGRPTVESAFAKMAEIEAPLEARFRDYLASRNDIQIIGPRTARPDTVGTVSFVHRAIASDEVTRRVNGATLGIRHGNMYAVRLLEGLNIAAEPGVVRASFVHYNTQEEVDRLIAALDHALA